MAILKNAFGVMRSKGVALKACVAVVALIPSLVFAQGGAPAWATTMLNDVQSAVVALIAAVVAIVAIMLVAQVSIRVTKRLSKNI